MTIPAAPRPKRPKTCQEPQAISVPPRLSASRMGMMPSSSAADPAQSMVTFFSSCGFRGGIWSTMKKSAMSPTGAFT